MRGLFVSESHSEVGAALAGGSSPVNTEVDLLWWKQQRWSGGVWSLLPTQAGPEDSEVPGLKVQEGKVPAPPSRSREVGGLNESNQTITTMV